MSQLPFRDRAADKMRLGMGTWTALFGMLTFMGGWIIGVDIFRLPFDNPQLTILNLVLSTLAGLQGVILLIASKRSDAQNKKLVKHISDETDEIDLLIKENTELTKVIHHLLEQK